jgi:uncharacterized protein
LVCLRISPQTPSIGAENLKNYIGLGKRLLQHRDRSDFSTQRFLVFCIRAMFNHQEIDALSQFFQCNPTLQTIEKDNAIFYEQLTRHLFYHQSTIHERLDILQQHFLFCAHIFNEAALQSIYYDKRLVLWEIPYKNEFLSIGLDFKYIDRKEGLMTISLQLAEKRIYHITFWFEQDKEHNPNIKIGALQGSYGGNGIIHELTKYFFGYRPKNLILFALRLLAQELHIRKISAVSNNGFYTNTHVRMDLKLKVNLNEFWLEAGGHETTDFRFFDLPLTERRKDIDEVKSQKRNLYRKRYRFLDELEMHLKENLQQYLL